MARIAGVDLPNNKRGEIGLTYIYGIGRSSANSILTKAGVDPEIKVRIGMTIRLRPSVRQLQKNTKLKVNCVHPVQMNIKRLMDIGCYRGIRHRIGLPVRGQTTKNNARTRKGRKKTVANKRKQPNNE